MRTSGTWKPGQSGNPKGRPKGAKNLFAQHVKDHIKKAFNIEIKNLHADLKKMSARDKWNIIQNLMKFVMPEKSEMKSTLKQIEKIKVEYMNDEEKELGLENMDGDEWMN